MTTPTSRFPLDLAGVGLATIALVVVACLYDPPPGSTPMGGSARPSAAASVESTATHAAPVTPTASPTASEVPSTPAPSSAACLLMPQTVALPSDRFTDIKEAPGATADRLTFVFGNPSLPGPAGPPEGSLEVAQAPYTSAGSGAPIEMKGEHVLQIRFSGMSLANDVGQETYVGPRGIETPDFPSLRHAVMFDASEGIVGWYVGYDGPGCVTLVRTANDLTLTIDHR